MLAALRDVRLLGHDYRPGEPIPEGDWDKVPERNRRALRSTRTVGHIKADKGARASAAPKRG